MKFDPGTLREMIRFEARGPGEDEYGNTGVGDWTTQFTEPARFLMHAGSEAVLAARLTGRQPVTMIVRSNPRTCTITPSWRAVDARTGTIYAIQSAADMDRKGQWITIRAEAGVTA